MTRPNRLCVLFNVAALFLPTIVAATPSLLPVSASTAIGYDPLALAQEALETANNPPPNGYTIREAKAGELKEGELARADSDGKTIVVDVAQVGAATHENDEGAASFVAVLGELLWHEYRHTEDYGTPSTPPSTGYGNGPCLHIALYADSIAHLKATIADTAQANGDIKTLCNLLQGWLHVHNSNLAHHNNNCDPDRDRLFGSEECE